METRVKDDPDYRERVRTALDGFLVKDPDRKLFDLPGDRT